MISSACLTAVLSPKRRNFVAKPPHFALCQSSPWIVTITLFLKSLGRKHIEAGPSAW